MPSLVPGSYPPFTHNYIRLVEADTIDQAIEVYSNSINKFFENIPEEKIGFRYAEGKWNIKEMLQHIIDTERIFAYRALCIARHDATPLPGFDEKTYADASEANARSWEDLLQEFIALRKSTDLMLKSFSDDQLNRSGITNDHPNTVIAIGTAIYGHILHHINILKERYL